MIYSTYFIVNQHAEGRMDRPDSRLGGNERVEGKGKAPRIKNDPLIPELTFE